MTSAKPQSTIRSHLATWVALILMMLAAGCTRTYYRRWADCDAYQVVREKSNNPEWALEGYTINVDPRSRMYDPNSIDCPPMPPDDPTAHQYMHCVDSKRGWPCWHANGDTPFVQNPTWEDALMRCPSGNVLIDEQTAMGLALLHSPNYQRELEDLYLSALDVSFERFRFDTQFFGGKGLLFTADGRDRSGTGESSSLLNVDAARLTARKLFSTGGELVIGLANSIVWQFAGPTTNASTTLLDFSFFQPLLRLGGRDFVLERLTLAERVLLGNVRLMERFRQQFYVNVITGRFTGGGPNRRGGVFGGSGLEGFSGVGGGGFGQLNFGGGGFQFGNGGAAGGAGAGLAGGYLGLVQLQQNIRNQQANVAALETSVAQLDAFFIAGRIDYFQVELARQAFFNAQSLLINSRLTYENQKDSFKQTLGIPPQIPIDVDDTIIRPFQLVDPDAIALQNELTQIQRQLGEAIIKILNYAETEMFDILPPIQPGSGEMGERGQRPSSRVPSSTDRGPMYAASYAQPIDASRTSISAVGHINVQPPSEFRAELIEQLEKIRQLLSQATDLSNRIDARLLPATRRDIDSLAATLEGRDAWMARLRRLIAIQLEEEAETCGGGPPPAVDADSVIPFDPIRLKRLPDQLRATVEDVQSRSRQIVDEIDNYERELEELMAEVDRGDAEQLYVRLSERILAAAPNTLNELSANLLGAILVQVRARTQNASLIPVELDWREATEIARERRLDWMNARASLVDSWRLIQFNADALQSDLNFIFNGDISNVGDNPLDLRGSRGRLRVGVEFDAPLTRLAERNTYRQALIEYQQARRNYYQFQDQVTTDLRNIIRGLRVNQVNFELRRAAVEVAVAQVELARLRLQEPPKPNEDATFGATTARDLVSALSDLLNVQNDFLSVWINHESLRRALDLELGTMQIDAAGLWIDPGPIVRLSDSTNEFDAENARGQGNATNPATEAPLERLPILPPPIPDNAQTLLPGPRQFPAQVSTTDVLLFRNLASPNPDTVRLVGHEDVEPTAQP